MKLLDASITDSASCLIFIDLQDNEFVIGNLNGDLAIFKGDCSYGLPTYFCRGLGTVNIIVDLYTV